MGLASCVSRFGLVTALLLLVGTAHAHPADLRQLRVTDSAVYAPIGVGGAEVDSRWTPNCSETVIVFSQARVPTEAAVVVSDVRTGRILAWATRGDRDYVADAFAPSASLFKLVTASALLEGGKVTPMTRECFEGGEHELRPSDLERKGSFCSTVGEALATATTWSSLGLRSGTWCPPRFAVLPQRLGSRARSLSIFP